MASGADRKWAGRLGAVVVLSCAAVVGVATSAAAASRDFTIRWTSSGSASAKGTMTIDDAVFLNPGANNSDTIPWVTSFSVTITGAASGNGTFTLADFSNIRLDTHGGTLDLARPLIGQNNGGLFDPVGHSGTGGDFNVFKGTTASAPDGTNYGEMTTNGGTGDPLVVTRITPALQFPFATEERKCQETIGKVGAKYLAVRYAALTGCYSALLRGKAIFQDRHRMTPVTDAGDCPSEFKTAAKLSRARQALRKGLEKACNDTSVGKLFACATTVDGLADATGSTGCLVAGIDARVAGLLLDEYGF